MEHLAHLLEAIEVSTGLAGCSVVHGPNRRVAVFVNHGGAGDIVHDLHGDGIGRAAKKLRDLQSLDRIVGIRKSPANRLVI